MSDLTVEAVDVAKEVHNEFGLWPVKDLVRRANLLDPAAVHDHYMVSDFQGFILVVGDQDTGNMKVVVEATEPHPQFLPHLGVERAKGFVKQEYLGLDGQGTGQGHTLPLTARKLVGVAVGEITELHQLQQIVHLIADVGT
jgi:hypothetical protein